MSWGPLRFVDSMNVFPTSLASMIDDLRACTHKQLPELFPLMASLHPQTAADALRPGAGVGLHPAQAAHALRALLRRRGVGDARGVGASARETPIHLITNEQAYVDVRASVMGGLSCIFQPFAQANNPELGEEDYNSEEPVSWIL